MCIGAIKKERKIVAMLGKGQVLVPQYILLLPKGGKYKANN
jgi:hypothetical protein